MTEQLTITPPPELVQQWTSLSNEMEGSEVWMQMAIFAAQWGADQELEACVSFLAAQGWDHIPGDLRAARRPKPPSLKQQARHALDTYIYGNPDHNDKQDTYNTIRRALDALPDD